MMALVPLLLKDDEFDENFQTYFDQRVAGYYKGEFNEDIHQYLLIHIALNINKFAL